MKVLCPICGQIFKTNFDSRPEYRYIKDEEFKCENCGSRLKQFTPGAYRKLIFGINREPDLNAVRRVVLFIISLLFTPLLVWVKTGIHIFGYIALISLISGLGMFAISIFRAFRDSVLVAEEYKNGT